MEKTVRVLRIQHSFVEPTNHRLLDELSKFPDLEVYALCPHWGIESGNLRVLEKPTRPDLTVADTVLTKHYATTFYLGKLGSTIRRLKPDIISVHEEPYSLTSGQVLFYRQLFSPGSRIVFNSAQNINKVFPFPFSAIEKWMFREASAGCGCCEGVREVVRAKGFDRYFEILPLGIDPELFSFRPHDGALEEGTFTIGYTGQIVEEKGVFTLLKAFSSFGDNVRLVLLGDGPDSKRLMASAREAGVAKRVEMPGPVPHTDVPEFMDRFDVLVVPSETTPTWKEQFGRVVTEAFSMGVPVVGSDSGSIPEVVGDAGIIFREKDHEQLRQILQDLIEQPDQLAGMSQKGRRRVLEKYTWKTVAEMTRDIFLRVMQE